MFVDDVPEHGMKMVKVRCQVCRGDFTIPVDMSHSIMDLASAVVNWRCLGCLNSTVKTAGN